MHRVQSRIISVVNFSVFFRLLFFVDTCGLVHDAETIFHLSYVLKDREMFSEIRVMPVKMQFAV